MQSYIVLHPIIKKPIMKVSFFLFSTLFLVGGITWTPITQPETTVKKIVKDEPDSLDVLSDVLALQRLMPPPPTTFKPGHVTALEAKNVFSPRENGYSIQISHKSLTPSPTVYKDLLLVSGGFGSKAYYAFDAKSGDLKWGIGLDDDGPTSAVVAQDIAVFNTESCTIFAVDAFTGEMLWSHYLGDPLMGTPSIAEGIVYTAYPASRVGYGGYGIQQQNQIPNALVEKRNGSVPVQNDSLSQLKVKGTHVLIALELKTGTIKWQKWIDGDVMSAPVIEGKELFITTFPGTFYKFDAISGAILAATASRATSAPVIMDDEVYLTSRSDNDGQRAKEQFRTYSRASSKEQNRGYERGAPYLDEKVQEQSSLKSYSMTYDAGNGFSGGAPANSGWKEASVNIGQSNVSSLQSFQGSRVLPYQGKNYATMGDSLICTNPKNGDIIWAKQIQGDLAAQGGFLATPPAAVGGRIVIATLEGQVLVIEKDNGKVIQKYDTKEQIRFQPVVAEGRIYVTTVKGKVFCFDTGIAALTGWPTWGGNAAHTNKIGK